MCSLQKSNWKTISSTYCASVTQNKSPRSSIIYIHRSRVHRSITNSERRFVKQKSIYICLFKCAATRSVHLEVVPNLSAYSFIQAFRRFISRKSLPRILISDNSTTFIAGSEEIKRLSNSDVITDYLSAHGVEWKFIPKRTPWYGGF